MSLYIGNQKIPVLNVRLSSSGVGNYQTKTISPSTTIQNIVADNGYDALSKVTINAIQTETKTVTTNGTVTPSSGKYLTSVTVNVPVGSTINNQNKTVTPTTSQQSITADSGYTGLGTVTVNRIPTNYLIPSGNKSITANGTNIDVAAYSTVSVSVSSTINNQNKTVTPTTSQQTINADSGYSGLGTVTVNAMPTMTLPTAATASATSGFSSKATIGRSTADQYINIPTGYNSAGAYYKISAVANGTAGTPTASKGTVSNNSISITPSVTNTTGYITGSTKTGTAVTVTASELVSGNKAITANGTGIDVTNYATVSVNVATGSTINNQNKTVTPSTSQQSITADSGYTGLGTVTVNAMPTMTLPTSASSSSSGTNKATISRSTSAQYINIPTGYNSAAAYYTISAVANGSVTAPSSISGTSATVSTGTNTLTLTKTISVTPNVTTAGYISSGTAGNASVSLTASVTTKAATTYNVSTSDQTIASGTYLTGTQTIRAVTHTATAAKVAAGQTVTIGDAGSATRIANISGTYTSDATAAAADIASGKTAYVNGSKLTGSLTFINIYTGTSAPSSSTGSNGDIYIQS